MRDGDDRDWGRSGSPPFLSHLLSQGVQDPDDLFVQETPVSLFHNLPRYPPSGTRGG